MTAQFKVEIKGRLELCTVQPSKVIKMQSNTKKIVFFKGIIFRTGKNVINAILSFFQTKFSFYVCFSCLLGSLLRIKYRNKIKISIQRQLFVVCFKKIVFCPNIGKLHVIFEWNLIENAIYLYKDHFLVNKKFLTSVLCNVVLLCQKIIFTWIWQNLFFCIFQGLKNGPLQKKK